MSKERYNQIVDEVYENFLMMSKKRVSKEMIEKFVKNTPKVEFINKIKTDERFSKYWGLKIEERELSLEERYKLVNIISKEKLPGEPSYTEEQQHSMLDELTPKRAISLTYYNETIKFYD
jgi:hypothetical protein